MASQKADLIRPIYHGRGKLSGAEISHKGAHVFKLRDDRVVRLEIFASRLKAIQSVETAVADA